MDIHADSSFEAVALPHADAVYRVARRLTKDQHEAEDLVQETFLKAYQAFARFEMREFGIRPWLMRILHNTFLNRRVRESRFGRKLEAAELEHFEEPAGSSAAADAIGGLDFDRLDAEVRYAIERLPDSFRVVLLLWATMEYSYEEIAGILDVPMGTVMSRLHRARQRLSQELKEYARANRLSVESSSP